MRALVATFVCVLFAGCGGSESSTGNSGQGGSENGGTEATSGGTSGGTPEAGSGGDGDSGGRAGGSGGRLSSGGTSGKGTGGTETSGGEKPSSGGEQPSAGSAGDGGTGGDSGSARRIYLFWVAEPDDAAITVLDIATGSVLDTKHVVTNVANATAIDFAALADGTFRVLWVDNVSETLWVLDSDFTKIDEVGYKRDTSSTLLGYVKRPDGSGRLGHWVHASAQSSVWFVPLLANDEQDATASIDIIGHELPWTPKQYFPFGDGSSLVLWWNEGKFELMELAADDRPTGKTIAPDSTFEFVAESYSRDAEGTVRMAWAVPEDDVGRAVLCTYASDGELAVFPTEEGWGPGKCSRYEGEEGWTFKGHVVVPE